MLNGKKNNTKNEKEGKIKSELPENAIDNNSTVKRGYGHKVKKGEGKVFTGAYAEKIHEKVK